MQMEMLRAVLTVVTCSDALPAQTLVVPIDCNLSTRFSISVALLFIKFTLLF